MMPFDDRFMWILAALAWITEHPALAVAIIATGVVLVMAGISAIRQNVWERKI